MKKIINILKVKIDKFSSIFGTYWLPKSFIILLFLIHLAILLDTFYPYQMYIMTNKIYYLHVFFATFIYSLSSCIALIALFKMRKWGFWVFVVATFAIAAFSLYAFKETHVQFIMNFAMLFLLWLLLIFDFKKSMWHHLK